MILLAFGLLFGYLSYSLAKWWGKPQPMMWAVLSFFTGGVGILILVLSIVIDIGKNGQPK